MKLGRLAAAPVTACLAFAACAPSAPSAAPVAVASSSPTGLASVAPPSAAATLVLPTPSLVPPGSIVTVTLRDDVLAVLSTNDGLHAIYAAPMSRLLPGWTLEPDTARVSRAGVLALHGDPEDSGNRSLALIDLAGPAATPVIIPGVNEFAFADDGTLAIRRGDTVTAYRDPLTPGDVRGAVDIPIGLVSAGPLPILPDGSGLLLQRQLGDETTAWEPVALGWDGSVKPIPAAAGPALATGAERAWAADGTTIGDWADHAVTGAACGMAYASLDGARTEVDVPGHDSCTFDDIAWSPSGGSWLGLHDGALYRAEPGGPPERVARVTGEFPFIAGATWDTALVEADDQVMVIDLADGSTRQVLPGTLALVR